MKKIAVLLSVLGILLTSTSVFAQGKFTKSADNTIHPQDTLDCTVYEDGSTWCQRW